LQALIVTADHFEDSELHVPCDRLRAEGILVVIASVRKGKITGKHGYETEATKTLKEIDPDAYDILILPGGKAPSRVRKIKPAIEIVKSFFDKNKPVAAICHGPQILVSAGILNRRRATCYPAIAQEIKDAGAIYEDQEVVVDGNLITSRQPSDLPAFMTEVMKSLHRSPESHPHPAPHRVWRG